MESDTCQHKADCNKDMNKEKDLVYLVTVVISTLSMMYGWLYYTSMKNSSHKI